MWAGVYLREFKPPKRCLSINCERNRLVGPVSLFKCVNLILDEIHLVKGTDNKFSGFFYICQVHLVLTKVSFPGNSCPKKLQRTEGPKKMNQFISTILGTAA